LSNLGLFKKPTVRYSERLKILLNQRFTDEKLSAAVDVTRWTVSDSGIHSASTMTKAKAKTKVKTHKATKKRFRLSATGKAMHRSSGTSHLAQAISSKRRRNLRGTTSVHPCMEPMIHAALNGYSN
jgi:large subunit ribosomal protein L35